MSPKVHPPGSMGAVMRIPTEGAHQMLEKPARHRSVPVTRYPLVDNIFFVLNNVNS